MAMFWAPVVFVEEGGGTRGCVLKAGAVGEERVVTRGGIRAAGVEEER